MNIFVVGFPKSFSKQNLFQLFEPHGEVSSAKVIYDKETKESRCFGFVEMPDDAEAKQAIEKLNELLIEDRKIIVLEAKSQKKEQQPL